MNGPKGSAWLAVVSVALVLACTPCTSAAVATPAPLTVFPAVSGDMLFGLLETDRDTDLVSPAGIDAALCSLLPVMSERARRQRKATSESDCGAVPSYISRSIWFSPALQPDPRGEALLAGTEMHHDAYPLNPAIDRWLAARHALPAPMRQPIAFAVVSALDFGRDWSFQFRFIEPRPYVFHGRRRDARVRFLAGRQLADIGDRSCIRGVLPLDSGGIVLMTALEERRVQAALHCLSRRLDMAKLVNAHFYMPQLELRRTSSVRDRLKRLGLTDLFQSSADPLPKLFAHQEIGDVFQAAELRTDWRGIRVRATTIAAVTLGAPVYETVLAYDHPFAMRVVDERGTTVAVAVVNDL